MTTSFMLADRDTAFRMRRPTLSNGSFVSDIDRDVDARLDELETLLGKHILSAAPPAEIEAEAAGDAEGEGEGADAGEGAAGDELIWRPLPSPHERDAVALLMRPLAPWRPTAEILKRGWPSKSLGDTLSKAKDDPHRLSLADHIDLTPGLAELKYDMKARLENGWYGLDANARAVLQDRPNIQDYIVARAYHIGRLRDPKAFFNYLTGNRAGVKSVVEYAVISAARTLVERERLKVPNYHEDNETFAKKLKVRAIPLSQASFAKAVRAVVNDVMYNADASKLLDEAKIGEIPEEIRPRLIAYIKSSKIPLTKDNINLFLPSFVTRAYEYEPDDAADVDTEETPEAEDRSYKVQFRDTPDAEIDIDRVAVWYAAQLFHGMVLGEELGVFDALQYMLHSKMLIGGGMQVRDKPLRDDLRLYTLSNEFRDLGQPGHPTEERTRASERKMWAREVFAQGEGQLIEGMQENSEFRQLWQVLMLESARYLERAQESFNPGSFVSKQNVMQAVEDLQYNLSTYCVGWPQVMAPAIDAELNFVLTRFIENPKIASQVLPAGGSWKRVIDKLNAERPKKAPIPAAALLYAKATQGQAILENVAEYTPAAFENEREFSGFIGLVDAYITTESKLQRRAGPPRRGETAKEEEDEPAYPPPDEEREPAEAGADEWDF